MRDRHAQSRRTVTQVMHSRLGAIPILANPLRLSQASMRYDMAPPVLGAHTDEVLKREVGLTDAQLARLRELKVI